MILFWQMFFLVRITSKTYGKMMSAPELAQFYPIPEKLDHPELEQRLNWYPLAFDKTTEDYFMNLAEEEDVPLVAIPQNPDCGGRPAPDAAILMDELVTPVAAQLHQNCISEGEKGAQPADLTAYVAVNDIETATYQVTHRGLEPRTH